MTSFNSLQNFLWTRIKMKLILHAIFLWVALKLYDWSIWHPIEMLKNFSTIRILKWRHFNIEKKICGTETLIVALFDGSCKSGEKNLRWNGENFKMTFSNWIWMALDAFSNIRSNSNKINEISSNSEIIDVYSLCIRKKVHWNLTLNQQLTEQLTERSLHFNHVQFSFLLNAKVLFLL